MKYKYIDKKCYKYENRYVRAFGFKIVYFKANETLSHGFICLSIDEMRERERQYRTFLSNVLLVVISNKCFD